ncbi:sterol desaturase family protein [Cecembia rubra]|uniref:Sterol desaturase/sphingolipid hydroxylase (Fatty acid hydroxylase superfamily) n=1 Tax=Cecembia rubra TaxID=1485585 RepID=A0A2P8E4X8_9BACT|nr:sterol desaturase family protein [Cecembia rubra]PSL04526.1 sterol desaturase/sphingolipid hydroxylase (fatty acid hydroxylase superfamily) [Cecembia rubra]
MELYAKALTFAIPFFLILIIIEEIAARKMKRQINYGMDTISSLSSGMTNTLKNLMGLSIAIVSYGWLVDKVALFHIESTWMVYVVAFIGMDFVGYWSHRFDHTINAFWNRHIVHHSSEEFNLSCALRQSVSAIVGIYFFLYIPMAFLGVPGEVVAIVAPIHLFAQFWYHTRLIGKMGFLEHILVTPSHHRVHHAINDIYLDKNLSQIFIFWDKLFGTFQEELDEEPPVYGVKKPVNTWNPLIINYVHMWSLIQDAWRTKSWWDKLRIWFMPTGWRPADVSEKYPWNYWKNAYEQVKYDSKPSQTLFAWSWLQLVVNFAMVFHVLVAFVNFQYLEVMLYAIFMMVSIFAYTSLMDKAKVAIPAEIIRFVMGIGLIYWNGGWFGLQEIIPGATVLIGIYLASSLLMAFWILSKETKAKLDVKPAELVSSN